MALTFQGKIIINEADKEGDVEIVMDLGYEYVYLTQDEVKQLIEHLEKQLIT